MNNVVRNFQSGSCQCGAVEFGLKSEKVISWICHCRQCQKKTASAFGISVPVKRAAFELRGTLSSHEYVADRGVTYTCWSCPVCGTRMYHDVTPNSEYITLQGGALDDAWALEPLAHVWTSRKHDWLPIPPEVEQFETQPEDLKAWRDRLFAKSTL